MKYYLVTGRMRGDDEDTTLTPVASSRAEAVAAFVEEMWAMEPGYDAGERALIQVEGEGVVVNGVYESASPITEAS